MMTLLWWMGCFPVQDFSSQCFFEPCRPQAPDVVLCGIMEQDCPGGQRCTLDTVYTPPAQTWLPICAPVPEQTVALGEPCVDWTYGTHDCEVGAMCLERSCAAMCLSDADCEEAGLAAACLRVFDGNEGYCGLDCDPLRPPTTSECPINQSCMRALDRFSCVPEYGDVPVGGRCTFVQDCVPGASCVVDTCRTHCDTRNGDDDCRGSLRCVAFATNPEGLEHIGTCQEAL